MAADIYGQMIPSLDGIVLAEATTVDTSLENNDQDVLTLSKGWAGITPSPQKRVTKIEEMILAAGVEYPFEQKELNKERVELGLQMLGSGEKLLSKGFLRNVSRRAGVGQTIVLSFEHHGEPTAFE